MNISFFIIYERLLYLFLSLFRAVPSRRLYYSLHPIPPVVVSIPYRVPSSPSLHPAPLCICLQHRIGDRSCRVHVAVRAARYAGDFTAAEATSWLRYALGEALVPDRLRSAKEIYGGEGE